MGRISAAMRTSTLDRGTLFNKEITANMYSMGEIDPVRPLSIIGLNGSMGNDKFRKIVHDQPSINFLKGALCLFLRENI